MRSFGEVSTRTLPAPEAREALARAEAFAALARAAKVARADRESGYRAR